MRKSTEKQRYNIAGEVYKRRMEMGITAQEVDERIRALGVNVPKNYTSNVESANVKSLHTLRFTSLRFVLGMSKRAYAAK